MADLRQNNANQKRKQKKARFEYHRSAMLDF